MPKTKNTKREDRIAMEIIVDACDCRRQCQDDGESGDDSRGKEKQR